MYDRQPDLDFKQRTKLLPMHKVSCSIKRINKPSRLIGQLSDTTSSGGFFSNELIRTKYKTGITEKILKENRTLSSSTAQNMQPGLRTSVPRITNSLPCG